MNTNPSSKRILAFGDSNTWGYIPGTKLERYSPAIRWTGVLQTILGGQYEVIEEGLNSRTLESEDLRPGKEGRSAKGYVLPCLDSHDPLDLVIIMLGTNELKAEYTMSVEQIGGMMRRLIELVLGRKSQFRTTTPQVILISPPEVNEEVLVRKQDGKYLGATEKSKQLADTYQKIAQETGVAFLNASIYTSVGEDGVHLTADGHRVLAVEITRLVHSIILSE